MDEMTFSAQPEPSQESTQLSGTLLRGNERALKSVLGEEVYQRALDSLDPEVRTRVEHITPLSWLPIGDAERVIIAGAQVAGRDVFDLNLEVTRLSTEQSLRTLWRAFLHFTTDSMIVSRAPRLYARAYDRGRCEARLDGSQLAEVQIYERPSISRMTREAFGAGIETVLRLAGRSGVSVTSRPTDDGAVYAIRLR